jgi:hypothetical protein
MITITYMLELEKPNISHAPINSLFVVLMGWNQVRLQALANWWNELNLKGLCGRDGSSIDAHILSLIPKLFLCWKFVVPFISYVLNGLVNFTLDRNFFVGLWETTGFIFYLVRKVFLKRKTITNLFDYS